MMLSAYVAGLLVLCAGLTVVSYLDRVYLELGGVATGRVRDNLDVFAAEVEPRLKLERPSAALTFRLLSHIFLVIVAALTIVAAAQFAATFWESAVQVVILPVCEVFFFVHLIPYLLLTHSTGRWLWPVVPVLRLLSFLVWPIRTLLEVGVSVAHLHEDKPAEGEAQQEGLEALVEVAEDRGILEPQEAALIEQVVEFGEKRVREVMTPRPDVVAIPAGTTLADLRQLFISTRFSRVPVYENSLDEIIGIAYARDVLGVPEADLARRRVREIVRPVLFVPETKLGSELLRELQQKKQQMAIAVDEYGNVAGLVTTEDLVEEIVGEIEDEDRRPAPDVVREADGSLLMRGSVSVERLEELLGSPIERESDGAATTVAGLLNELAGHVPTPGEAISAGQVRFEVIDANQRKVLRLRVRTASAPVERKPFAVSPPDEPMAKATKPVGETTARATRTAK